MNNRWVFGLLWNLVTSGYRTEKDLVRMDRPRSLRRCSINSIVIFPVPASRFLLQPSFNRIGYLRNPRQLTKSSRSQSKGRRFLGTLQRLGPLDCTHRYQ